MKKLLVFSVLLIGFASCKSKIDLSLNQVDRSFLYDSLLLKRSVKITNGNSNTTLTSSANYYFPVFKDAALSWLNDTVASGINGNLNTIRQNAEIFLTNFEKYCNNSDYHNEWELWNNCNANYLNDSILILEFDKEEYSGGAHPIHNSAIKIFNLKSKNRLTLQYFLNAASDTVTIRNLALLQLKKMKGLLANQKLDDDAGMFINDNTFYLSKNFEIDSANIRFFYNEYELQAYVFGPINIEIPKRKLYKILKFDIP